MRHLDGAAVLVAEKMLARLKILDLDPAINVPAITNHIEAHIHDPMHVSDFVHVFSRYLHSFIVLLLVFYYAT